MKRILKKTIGAFLVAFPLLLILTLMAIEKGIVAVLAMVAIVAAMIGIIFLGMHLIMSED